MREEAFKNEIAYLGLSRESVSFKGVDGRHNSSSAAVSPYAHLANTSRGSLLFGGGNNRGSSSYTGSAGGGGGRSSVTNSNTASNATRNPLSSSAQAALEEGMYSQSANSGNSSSGRKSFGWARESELEMRETRGTCPFRISSFVCTVHLILNYVISVFMTSSAFCSHQIIFDASLTDSSIKRVESHDSVQSASSDVTVKWKDTTDVEFSMGRVDSRNNSAPDAW